MRIAHRTMTTSLFQSSLLLLKQLKIKFSVYIRFICTHHMATHSSILAWRIPWTEEPGKVKKEQEKIFERENHTVRDEEKLVAEDTEHFLVP